MSSSSTAIDQLEMELDFGPPVVTAVQLPGGRSGYFVEAGAPRIREKMITVKDAATLLDCSERTVLWYLQEGRLEGRQRVRLGPWKVMRSSVDEMLGRE